MAVYAHVVNFFFITYDDPAYVTENFHVRAGISPENLQWAFGSQVDANWLPLTLVSHMAMCDWFGLKSGAHHAANVGLHILATLLLFAALKRATGAVWASAFTAAIFALHPLHVESVAWVSERKDVLSTFFWFAALYAYVRYAEQPKKILYALVLILFAMGLMSKPMLVTFPFTLLLIDAWPLKRRQWVEKIPFFALSAASAVATYLVQKAGGTVQNMPLGERVSNALISYVSYMGQTLWPAGLALFYPYRHGIAAWQVVAALAVILSISGAAVFYWRSRPYLAIGWFWYLGTLVPVIGLVQVGVQSHADRYMYVPMVGLAMIFAWGGAEIVGRWPWAKPGIACLAVFACLGCFFVASAQAEYWRDSEAVYTRAIDVTENNYMAQSNLADYLLDVPGRAAEAVPHYQEAMRIRPNEANPHNGLGVYYLQTGNDAEAARQFEAALRADPSLAAPHFNLGLIYAKDPRRVQEALAEYETAVRLMPAFAQAQKQLGLLLVQMGRKAEGIAHLEAALRLQPDGQLAELIKGLAGDN